MEEEDLENEKEIDIDLGKVFYMFRTRVLYIILGALIAGFIAGGITELFITPKYSTSCTLYVYSNVDRVNTRSTINSSELEVSQRLVDTYIVVLNSDTVLEKVIDELGLTMSASALRSKINCAQEGTTEVFRVTVTDPDPEMAAAIANKIAEIVPDEIVRVVKAGGVEVLDYAKVPTKPSSPNLKKNIAIGLGTGFIAFFVFFYIYELFDTTISTERELEREIDLPILGSIPHILPANETAEEERKTADKVRNRANKISNDKEGGK